MLKFKEFIVQEGKITKALTVAGGVGGALLNKIPGVETTPGTEVLTAIGGATAGNIIGNRIETLFKPKQKTFKVKIVNNKLKSHIPDPKSQEHLNKRKPLPHQADPKPIRKE